MNEKQVKAIVIGVIISVTASTVFEYVIKPRLNKSGG